MAQTRLCTVCSRPFAVPRTSRRLTDSPECSRKHAANLRRAWRVANPEKIRAYGASLRHLAAVKKYNRGAKPKKYQYEYRHSERGRIAQRKYREARRKKLGK